MVEVIPAIIPQDFEDLETKLYLVKGLVDKVQIDFIDGIYGPEMSWPYTENFQDYKDLFEDRDPFSEFDIEFDCMVDSPEEALKRLIVFKDKTYIIHFESSNDFQKAINLVKESGNTPALAFKPETSIEKIEKYIEQVSFIQLMGNNKIGFHGVDLDESVHEKISTLRGKYPNLIIGIDIGVNFETAPKLVEAGVNRLVSGSAIFRSENIEEAISKLKNN